MRLTDGLFPKWIFFGVLLSLFPASSNADIKTYSFGERGKFSLDMPGDWEDVTGLFGMELMVGGPYQDGARPVISVTTTGISDLKFDEKALSKRDSEYREGREQWLKKRKGRSISYDGYHAENWASGIRAHSIGYRYDLNGTEFIERSHYVECGNKLYHVKELLRASQGAAADSLANRIARSFKCL